jgi:hypothetical protein
MGFRGGWSGMILVLMELWRLVRHTGMIRSLGGDDVVADEVHGETEPRRSGELRPRDLARPAFYALPPGRVSDYVTLLHPPYTAWHLSYVAIGAAIAPQFAWARLVAALAGFALAVGVGAHALDELHGRPLGTAIPRQNLILLATTSITAAVGLGIVGAATTTYWLAPFVAAGALIVVAYNLELFGGRFHSDRWFALAWGSFPLITGYVATSGSLRPAALAAAVAAYWLSLAQRRLSTRVRFVRRKARTVTGTVKLRDGGVEPVTPEFLIAADEAALRALCIATVALAVALIAMRTL